MFDGHYIDWRNSRMNGILEALGEDFFKNKSIVELGCGYGDFGNMILQKGAKRCLSIDARSEHIKIGKERYPLINFLYMNCENMPDDIHTFFKDYDILIHFGLLYHLENPIEHLTSLSNHFKVILLESEVIIGQSIINSEIGYDQSITGKSLRISLETIIKCLEDNGYKIQVLKSKVLDNNLHKYSWNEEDFNKENYYYRRMIYAKLTN
jgi:2-polyprenyl-3-methyl-5-hydroxy-6-metoxy-1,4-benzoquinol methylase